MKKYYLLISVIVFSLLLSCKSSQKGESSNYFDGTWVGEAYQFNVDQDWSMRFKIDRASRSYIVTYPSLNCGGKCKLISDTPNALILQEMLEYGEGTCVNGGKIEIIKYDENKCTFFYYYNIKDDDPIAVGELIKSSNYQELIKNKRTYNQ